MKRARAILIFVIFPLAVLHGQITVQAGRQAKLAAPGARSAVSLDSKVADAAVADGILSISGIGPGDTRVVAVLAGGLQEVRVHVIPGPPRYPPGFVAPRYAGSDSGSVEFLYSSDRNQVESAVDLASQAPDRLRQLHVVTAVLPGAGDQPNIDVPSASYRMATANVDMTLLDKTVDNSPLTLENVVVRGFHLKDGLWDFHGGYTASATFQNVFLPAEKEFVAGVSHTDYLSPVLQVTPNVYFLRSIDLATGRQRSAMITSLLVGIHILPGWELKGEVAYGRSPAFATELNHQGTNTTLRAHLVKKSPEFPSVRVNGLPGLTGDLSWNQIFSPRLSMVSGGSVNRIDLQTIKQDSENAFTNLRYQFARSWSVGTGASFGLFVSPGVYAARAVNLPQQINFDTRHFGAGFQYNLAVASDSFSNGSGFTQTVRLNVGRFQAGVFANWQNEALSVNSLFSETPGLQQELQKLGINAVTPDQLAALLQDAAFLQSLGLSTQAKIVTIPHRLQEGGNLSWASSGARPHRLSLSFIESQNRFPASSSRDYDLTGAYTKDITLNNQIQLNASFLQSTFSGRRQFTPLVSVSFRHAFTRAPELFSARRRGSISGTVFIDAKRQGRYEPGMVTVAKAVVILDGQRAVATDRSGYFHFGGVLEGDHHIQLKYDPDRAHSFTTPDETVVASGSTCNFGIAFPTLDLWGRIEDDAGNGLENVKVQVSGASGQTMLATDSSGKFLLPDVQPGSYQIQVYPQTVPIGYATEQLAPVTASVTAASSGHPLIKIAANRALTGSVTVYDATAGSYVPVKGAVVEIAQLAKKVVTNAAGKFTIGGLAPGEIVVKVVAGQASMSHTIDVPVHPVTLRDDFRVSSISGQIAYSLAGMAR